MIKTLSSCLKKHYFSTTAEPFQQFLSKSSQQLVMKRQPGRGNHATEVHVPHIPLPRQQIQLFFEKKEIRNKTVLINIDSSNLLGMKRLFALNYAQKHVYKGNAQPIDILKVSNPSSYVDIEQLCFDQNIFAITDPLFLQKSQKLQCPITDLTDQIIAYYDANKDHGITRLQQQYRISPEYLHIVQTAHNMDNKIYFIGINEYELRNILSSYLSLVDIKNLFMECVKEGFQNDILNKKEFYHLSKDILWLNHYSFLQPINHQIINTIKKQVKGVFFGHSYHFLKPNQTHINFKDMKDRQADNLKLQKNAIMEVLFGSIWNKPYTNNPFPYLTEPFLGLSKNDQQLVRNIFQGFMKQYSTIKSKYVERSPSA